MRSIRVIAGVLCLWLCAMAVHALSIAGHVLAPSNVREDWPVRVRVLLDNGVKETYLDKHGKFEFHDVDAGWHTLEVLSLDFLYNVVRVEILESGFTRATVANWLSLSASTNIEYPLKLRPAMVADYFQKREGWSPFDLLKNPMILMLLFMGGMGFLMPKMMEGMDQETLEEVRGKPVTIDAWEALNKPVAAIGSGTHRNAGKSSGKKTATTISTRR